MFKQLLAILLCNWIAVSVFSIATANESAVSRALDAFHLAASQADGDAYFNLIHKDGIFIGTDATERWTKTQFQAFSKPYFSKGTGWTYAPRDRNIQFSTDESIVWFDELLDNENYGECRGTGVLINTQTGWKIMQYHLTIPLPNALADSIVERIAEYKTQGSD